MDILYIFAYMSIRQSNCCCCKDYHYLEGLFTEENLFLIFQVAPGIESRFADELPPPSSNNYGVFSSSSSHTLVGPDGKTISRKSSTTGVNDNGKITYRTVQE